MGGQGEQVNAESIHAERDVPHRLHGIGVQIDAGFPCNFSDFGDWLNGAYLVVGVHDGNDDGFAGNRPAYVIGVNHTVPIHRQVGYLEPLSFQEVAGFQNGVVLNSRGDDMVALAIAGINGAFQRGVIRLGTAAGEDNFLIVGAQERRYAGSCFLNGFSGVLPADIDTGRISKRIGKVGKHRLNDVRMSRCSGGIVKVDSPHTSVPRFHYL